MTDKSQRTEKPTPRRIAQARREGRFAVSREAVGALQFLAFSALTAAFGAGYCSHIVNTTRYLFRAAFTSELTSAGIMRLLKLVVQRDFLPLGIFGGLLLAVSLAAQLGVTRLGASWKGLMPNFKRLNPLSRLREMPRQNVPALIQAMLLLPLFGAAVYSIVSDNWSALLRMPLQGVEQGARQAAISVQSLLWKVAMLFLVLGAFDYWRQNRRYLADLRMSKQELREESKEMEGNPRVRKLRREWLRRRMRPPGADRRESSAAGIIHG